jgi:hypothetical protein
MILYKYNIYVCICIPESFNTNISHQLFDYTITFENSQHYNKNSKGDFVLQKPVLNARFEDLWYTINIFYLDLRWPIQLMITTG